MKPIPAPSSLEDSADPTVSSASDLLKSAPSRHTNSNRRSPTTLANQAYPWLLAVSTAIAIFFGLMYIYKPVVISSTGTDNAESEQPQGDGTGSNAAQGLLPQGSNLPGDSTAVTGATTQNLSNPNTAPIHSRYEETNMRVQHILTAKSEDGHVSRIDLEVPVLYQSRNLRWSPVEVARAEDLMIQLMEYQDKSRKLRTQGAHLLSDWNTLMGQSIPASRLRADSPSLPENQNDALIIAGAADTTTRDAIEIQAKEDEP